MQRNFAGSGIIPWCEEAGLAHARLRLKAGSNSGFLGLRACPAGADRISASCRGSGSCVRNRRWPRRGDSTTRMPVSRRRVAPVEERVVGQIVRPEIRVGCLSLSSPGSAAPLLGSSTTTRASAKKVSGNFDSPPVRRRNSRGSPAHWSCAALATAAGSSPAPIRTRRTGGRFAVPAP